MGAICLILAVLPALAAPVRDKQSMEEAADTQFEELISLYAGAAILRNVPTLAAGETPPQALIEGVLLVGLESGVLPRSSGSSGTTDNLGLNTLKDLYGALFATGEYTPIRTPSCPCIEPLGGNGSLSFDFSSLAEDMIAGAYIYQTKKTADGVIVYADVYTAPHFFGRAAEAIPEDCLTWETTMTLTLQRSDASMFGYRLVSYETTPGFLDGALSEWQVVTESGYTASIPSVFQKTGEGTYQTADGAASLAIAAQSDARSEKLDYYLSRFQSANQGATLTVEADLGYFSGVTETSYTLCFALEGNGQVYTLTLQYPKERAAEFSLYAEIIRNSFAGEGLAVG